MKGKNLQYDALVVGGGITGLQAALDLADQGYQVAIVEKNPSIGGNMIRLSKVFPTLDCASCITTPKMAAAAHHPNITILTLCELLDLTQKNGQIKAKILQHPRYVDPQKCIGCRQCEYNCPVLLPDQEQGGFSAKKAISIPFSNAIPQIAYLDANNCMLCGKCAQVCPKEAINYFEQPTHFEISAKTTVMATGFKMSTVNDKKQYGKGKILNVIDALQMERLLAPHGPYNRVLRPSDGKEPESIAYIQCAGSRDLSMGVSYCSRICCMYAIKQAMLLSGALPLADITIYYMDIRAFGKGYEQFYQNAKAMGIEFIKAKVARLNQGEDQQVIVHYEDQSGEGITAATHDLVVLSLGVRPQWQPPQDNSVIRTAKDGFLLSPSPKIAPTLSPTPGIFQAGAGIGPKDIVDSITEAGAAAMEAAKYLQMTAETKK